MDVLQDEVNRVSFGTLVTAAKSGILGEPCADADRWVEGDCGILFGHVARGNLQWRESSPGGEGLAVFLGPDAYISPSWYMTKEETGKVIPTWDYIAIHVRGPVTFFEDTARIREIVTKLTEHHEAYSKKPWKVTDAPPDFIEGELRQIVGFEMTVVKIDGKWKLSQNGPEADRDRVMVNLLERDGPGDEEVSYEMKRR